MSGGLLDFEEYIVVREPHMRKRAEAWRVAIGLQAVDGLQVSEYLQEMAVRNIEGDITIDEARKLVRQYYTTKTFHDEEEAENEQADKVSTNISKLLQTDSFTFSVAGFAAIHRAIFEGVFKHAGKFREFDISKKEWVLEADSVVYAHWQDIRMTIEFDLDQERQFKYSGLEKGQMVEHVSRFVAGLWQIHPFREGNTRTTAIFAIKYLRSLGFEVDNNLFAHHSWYFRNALVRANYKNAVKGIDYTPIYLERFFRNLLLGEKWELRNRYLHIHPTEEWREQINLADIEDPDTSTDVNTTEPKDNSITCTRTSTKQEKPTGTHTSSAVNASEPQSNDKTCTRTSSKQEKSIGTHTSSAVNTIEPKDNGMTCTRTSTERNTHTRTLVNDLNPNSKYYTNNANIIELVKVIGLEEMSVKQMMESKKLKNRVNFLDYHLAPSLKERFVCMKFPDRPNHPRQRYMLTVKGMTLYEELTKK